MILTTTPSIEGKQITRYHGIVSGQAIMGANIFRDFFASIRDIVGGRSVAYEGILKNGRDEALKEIMDESRLMGANAIVGINIDYGAVGASDSMLMISASGTAVTIE